MSERLSYFAYGSNLCLPRLRFRVPGVELIGTADLHGFELNWNKRSFRDRSGKCTIRQRETHTVHGALFSISKDEMGLLDRAEGLGKGYDSTTITLVREGTEVQATTYVAESAYVDPSLLPYRWYRDLVVCGGRMVGLPEAYVAALAGLKAVVDSDEERSRAQRRFLCESCK